MTDTTTGKTLQVMDCDRWAEIHWSPNDKKFAIENHWDGQASYLQIFEIVSSENRIGLVEIYHSPWLAQLLGVEWKLKSWSIKKGRATIIRKAVTKLTGAKYKDQEEFQVLLD